MTTPSSRKQHGKPTAGTTGRRVSKRRRVATSAAALVAGAVAVLGFSMSAGQSGIGAQRASGPFAPFDKVDATGFSVLAPRLFAVSDLITAEEEKEGKPYRVLLSGEGPTHEPIRVAAELSDQVPGTAQANARSMAERAAAASGGSISDVTAQSFSVGLQNEASFSFNFLTKDGTPAQGVVVYAKIPGGKDLSIQILCAAKDAKIVGASLVPVVLDSVRVK